MAEKLTTARELYGRRPFLLGGAASAALVLAGTTPSFAKATGTPPIKVYKSPSCGCCGQWVEYMTKHGFNLDVVNQDNLEIIKKMARVPEKLWSCHTSVIGKYVVEGHVPVDAVRKLLAEKPNLKGIAIPGMPSGSPGMPGRKAAPFKVIGFSADGKMKLYMRI
jgi:hypothetical protein